MEVTYPIRGKTGKDLRALVSSAKTGFFPIGVNQFWHGGVHLPLSEPLQAVADGDLVAYRINKKTLTIKGKQKYSTGFVLTRHTYTTPKNANIEFFCLYMHLLPPSEHTVAQRGYLPSFLPIRWETKGKLNLRGGASGGAKALCTLEKATKLEFVGDPLSPTGAYTQLKPGSYTGKDAKGADITVTLDAKTHGFVMFSAKYVIGGFDDKAATYDAVVEPAGKEVRCGQILGLPGPYLDGANVCHIEIFCDTSQFLENPGKDVGVARTLEIAPGADLRTFEPYIGGMVAAGEFLELKEDPAKIPKKDQYREVQSKAGDQGWVLRSDLGKYSKPNYPAKKALRLLIYDPDAGGNPPSAAFSGKAGSNKSALTLVAKGAKTKTDDKGTIWYEVAFDGGRGWLQDADPKVKAVTPYDWPEWQKIQESGKFSQDGFCDAKELIKLLDPDKSGNVDLTEIKSATADPIVGEKLARLASQHPTEWDAQTDKGIDKWKRLKEKPWSLGDAEYKATITFIETLQFWDDIKNVSLPDAKKVWHVHPIGFLEDLIKLDVPFTHADRIRVRDAISKFEGAYDSCNEDKEFAGAWKQLAYKGVVHIGLSWGFIQFTQDGGSLGDVLTRMNSKDPTTFQSTFGSNWQGLLDLTNAQGKNGRALWMDAGKPKAGPGVAEIRSSRVQKLEIEIPTKQGAVSEKEDLWEGEWLKRFQAAGKIAVFQEAQREIAEEQYMVPALKLCKRMNLRSEKSIAFAFDRMVNEGTRGGSYTMRKPVGGKYSISPYSEHEYLEEVRDASTNPGIRNRLQKILDNTDLHISNFNADTY